jgi:hypothetical protein
MTNRKEGVDEGAIIIESSTRNELDIILTLSITAASAAGGKKDVLAIIVEAVTKEMADVSNNGAIVPPFFPRGATIESGRKVGRRRLGAKAIVLPVTRSANDKTTTAVCRWICIITVYCGTACSIDVST